MFIFVYIYKGITRMFCLFILKIVLFYFVGDHSFNVIPVDSTKGFFLINVGLKLISWRIESEKLYQDKN